LTIISESIYIESIFAFFWALILCSFAVPPIIFLSFRKKLLDVPTDDRRIHFDSTPRLGGLALFAGFMSASMIFGDLTHKSFGIQQILAGVLLLFFAGVKDDIVPITPFKKFFVQIISTGIVVFVGDLRVTNLHGFMGVFGLENIGMSYAFTFVMIIAITNAINLIDGLNGLAGTLVLVISTVFGFLFYQLNSPLAMLYFALSGAIIGFLRYNLFDGRIFMGDSGSMVLGFMVAVACVSYIETDLSALSKTPHMCIAIVIVPMFDTLRVFVTRIIQGKSPFSPDKNHIHHRLMRMGLSQIQTVIALFLFNVSAISLVYFLPKIEITLFVCVVVTVAVIVSFVFKLTDKTYVE
jgi:UDP-GlcNAc:undecaprenyl-phosphate/decaprenyl-phosphate GlcNAc-1-phosphate transferase